MHVVVDILLSLPGITHAITNIAISMPQKTSLLPNRKAKAAGDEATPRDTKADMSSPMNILRYTRFITAFVWAVTLLPP